MSFFKGSWIIGTPVLIVLFINVSIKKSILIPEANILNELLQLSNESVKSELFEITQEQQYQLVRWVILVDVFSSWRIYTRLTFLFGCLSPIYSKSLIYGISLKVLIALKKHYIIRTTRKLQMFEKSYY